VATRTQSAFLTVKTEGALLPADLLKRLSEGDKEIEGLSPESYHLDPSDKINEATNQAWIACRDAWERFQKQRSDLPEADKGTSLTRERWLLKLFQELGYGRLQTQKSVEIEGKTYGISHGWGNAPIHLISFRYDLDTTSHGTFRTSPHSLVQEFLNRSDDHLWAFVSNGLQLRILRDNVSFSRPAYVEFDLEAMMEGEVYSDFLILWLLCHQSRVESDIPEQCWLEKWHQTAKQQGTRVLDRLRDGVEKSIEAFGQGFLAHRGNVALRQKLADGKLTTPAYYQQLLRLVYRLIFLFVAEDRDLLLTPDADSVTRKRYEKHYALSRIRRLAERRRGTRHSDLWEGVKVVFKLLYAGEPRLGLPALGSMLFSAKTMPDLDDCALSNDRILEAIRYLAFTVERNVLRQVDYKNLGSEELGSVYESLLELHPDVNADAATFELSTVAGSERKTTGSYYTPSSLINCLLDSALDPVVEEALKKPDREKAILDLKVCDPACGSGHFLIAAANRLSHHLASVRTGDEEPSPAARRAAFRDVVSHCIYGVDINPMAVELCKVALWLESIDPGKPLSFLDHRILCGNSLIGATPRLLAEGIPDDAFKPIEGDDKAICNEYKRRNKDEKKGQLQLDFGAMPSIKLGNLVQTFADLAAMDDESLEDVEAKEKRYADFVESASYQSARLLADAWCAAFVWKKDKSTDDCITESWFRRIEANPHSLPPWMRDEVFSLHEQFLFFHWHLSFPDVFQSLRDYDGTDESHSGWTGGFDLILGNPPWETMSPDTKEFFSAYAPEIRFRKKTEQRALIDKLLHNQEIAHAWAQYRRGLFAAVHFMKCSQRFRLFAPGNLGKGDFDLYRMFVETALFLSNENGVAAQLVKSGLYNGANAQAIRKELFENWQTRLVLGFVNAGQQWFPNVHPETRFAMYVARRGGPTTEIPAAFNVVDSAALASALDDLVRIPVTSVFSQSSEALAIPETASRLDIQLTELMQQRWPRLGDVDGGPPHRHFQREVDMGIDRDRFDDVDEGLPLMEGRMIARFDHRAKAYRSGRGRAAVWESLSFDDPSKAIIPQWRVPPREIPAKLGDRTQRYRVVWCDIATPTAARSLTAALVPPGVICGDTAPTMVFEHGFEWAYMPWLAVANSLCMDFLVRKRISLHIKYVHMDSLPFPRFSLDDGFSTTLGQLALRLTCTAPEMTDYWNAMAKYGWCDAVASKTIPPGLFGEEERLLALARIEGVVATDVFDLDYKQFEFVLSTFEVLKKQEIREKGKDRSLTLALDAFKEYQRLRAAPAS
jgi:hypothetical protein